MYFAKNRRKKQKNNKLNEALPFYEKAVEYFLQYAELRCEKAFWYKDVKNAFAMFDAYYVTINALLATRKKNDDGAKNKMEADSKALLQYKNFICLLKIYIDTLTQQRLQNGEAKILEKLIQLYDEALEWAADLCNDLIIHQNSAEQKIEYCNLALHYYDRLIVEKKQREQPVPPEIFLSWLYVNGQKTRLHNGQLADAEKVVRFTDQLLQTNIVLNQKADVHLYRREAYLAKNDPAQIEQETQLFKDSFSAAKASGLDVGSLEEDYQKFCETKPVVTAVPLKPVTYLVPPKKRIRANGVDASKDIQAPADASDTRQLTENELSEQQKKKLQDLEAENVRLKVAAIAAHAEFEAIQQKMLTLAAERARLQAELAGLNSLAKSQQDQLKELQVARQESSNLKVQNRQLSDELRQVKRQRDDTYREKQDLKDKNRALAALNDRLAQQLKHSRVQQNDEPAYHARYEQPYPDDYEPRNNPYRY